MLNKMNHYIKQKNIIRTVLSREERPGVKSFSFFTGWGMDETPFINLSSHNIET